jgi:hypothetical protein
MRRTCEICESLASWGAESEAKRRRASDLQTTRTRRLLLGNRIVAVCDRHAQAIAEAGCTTLGQLRELFAEAGGHRSLVPRRAALDRRVFPPRPEGRRLPGGRRATDGAD